MCAFVKIGAGNILKYGRCLFNFLSMRLESMNGTIVILLRQGHVNVLVVTLYYYAVSLFWLRFFSCFQFSITNFMGRKYLVRGPNTGIMPAVLPSDTVICIIT